jgi:hypothetical protein
MLSWAMDTTTTMMSMTMSKGWCNFGLRRGCTLALPELGWFFVEGVALHASRTGALTPLNSTRRR